VDVADCRAGAPLLERFHGALRVLHPVRQRVWPCTLRRSSRRCGAVLAPICPSRRSTASPLGRRDVPLGGLPDSRPATAASQM
jgi:hypothetical protein